jgi:predicted aconitase with swiveling domain
MEVNDMTDKIILKGRKVVGGRAQGEAIVSPEPITFVGGVDPLTGILTEAGHHLEGVNLAGKVLVYPTGKGSTGSSYRIYDMAVRGTGPVAFVQVNAEPIATIGAIISNMPVVDSLEENPCEVIKDGDFVEVDGDTGTVSILKCRLSESK